MNVSIFAVIACLCALLFRNVSAFNIKKPMLGFVLRFAVCVRYTECMNGQQAFSRKQMIAERKTTASQKQHMPPRGDAMMSKHVGL